MQKISRYYGRFRSGEKIVKSIMTREASKMRRAIAGSVNERLRRTLKAVLEREADVVFWSHM